MPALIRKRGVGVCDGASRDSSCFFEKDNMTTHLHKLSWTCILQLQFQRSAPQVDCKSVVGCSRPPTAWPAMLCFYLHTKPITAPGTFCQLHKKTHAQYTHRLWKRCSITAPTTATCTACKLTTECLAMNGQHTEVCTSSAAMVSYPVGEKHFFHSSICTIQPELAPKPCNGEKEDSNSCRH